jgi:hypothetical protein
VRTPVTRIPLYTGLGVSLFINSIPFFRAFVLQERDWGQAGWGHCCVTVPASAVFCVAGLIATIWASATSNEHIRRMTSFGSAAFLVVAGLGLCFFLGMFQ